MSKEQEKEAVREQMMKDYLDLRERLAAYEVQRNEMMMKADNGEITPEAEASATKELLNDLNFADQDDLALAYERRANLTNELLSFDPDYVADGMNVDLSKKFGNKIKERLLAQVDEYPYGAMVQMSHDLKAARGSRNLDDSVVKDQYQSAGLTNDQIDRIAALLEYGRGVIGA